MEINQEISIEKKYNSYFTLILIIIVVSVSLLNLTQQWGEAKMWFGILTFAIGVVIPAPKLEEAFKRFYQNLSV